MSQVFIDCPKTGEPVYIGLNYDWFGLDSATLISEPILCPRCGEYHRWSKEDAYLKADGGEA